MADALADRWGVRLRLVGTRVQAGEGVACGQPVIVVKPLTYMNRSGQVIAELTDNLDSVQDMLVVVDDVALPLGSVRLRPRGSNGGHNGLRSIENALDTVEYPRLRIGVGPPETPGEGLADYVLGKFDEADRAAFLDAVPNLVAAVECWISDGMETAMNRFNRRASEED